MPAALHYDFLLPALRITIVEFQIKAGWVCHSIDSNFGIATDFVFFSHFEPSLDLDSFTTVVAELSVNSNIVSCDMVLLICLGHREEAGQPGCSVYQMYSY